MEVNRLLIMALLLLQLLNQNVYLFITVLEEKSIIQGKAVKFAIIVSLNTNVNIILTALECSRKFLLIYRMIKCDVKIEKIV